MNEVVFHQTYRHKDGGIYVPLFLYTCTKDGGQCVFYEHKWPFEYGYYGRPIEEWTPERFEPISDTEVSNLMFDTSREEAQAGITHNKKVRKIREALEGPLGVELTMQVYGEHNDKHLRELFVSFMTMTPLFYGYKIICDETNNTPDVIDRHEIKVAIYDGDEFLIDFTIGANEMKEEDVSN